MREQPTRWRKKPVEVEAMGPLTHDNSAGIAYWCGGAVSRRLDEVLVRTLEGEMLASLGDYVIRGVKGEFCPCKPDIFKATYEPVRREGDPCDCGDPVGLHIDTDHEGTHS